MTLSEGEAQAAPAAVGEPIVRLGWSGGQRWVIYASHASAGHDHSPFAGNRGEGRGQVWVQGSAGSGNN